MLCNDVLVSLACDARVRQDGAAKLDNARRAAATSREKARRGGQRGRGGQQAYLMVPEGKPQGGLSQGKEEGGGEGGGGQERDGM